VGRILDRIATRDQGLRQRVSAALGKPELSGDLLEGDGLSTAGEILDQVENARGGFHLGVHIREPYPDCWTIQCTIASRYRPSTDERRALERDGIAKSCAGH